jgi:hypothetical protein
VGRMHDILQSVRGRRDHGSRVRGTSDLLRRRVRGRAHG